MSCYGRRAATDPADIRPRGGGGGDAVVEERQLLKTLRWYDGFVIALANPGFLLGSLGYSVGDLGGWGAAMLWGISAIVAVFINTLYSELAAMFPDKSGGLALYAHEALAQVHDARRADRDVRLLDRLVGRALVHRHLHRADHPGCVVPRRAVGGASSTRDVDRYFSTGTVKVGLPQLIAIGLILAVWLFNVFGVRVGVSFGYLAGALLMVPLFVMMILPFINGSFDSANLDNTIKANRPGLGRPPALARLVMADVLVGLGGRRLCDLRARVQGHGARHEARAALRGALLALRLHPPAHRLRRRRRRAEPSSAYDYVGAMNEIVGSTTLTDFFVVCLVAELHHHDEHGDGRRRSCAVRHLDAMA